MSPNHFRIAIVGAATLKGRELKDALEELNFPAIDVKLLDDDESLGQLEAVGDEATFIQSVEPERFQRVDFAFFTSDEGFTRRHWQSAKQAGSTVIDLSYALEDQPSVPISSPWMEREFEAKGKPRRQEIDISTTAVVTAHPAATILALLLLRLETAYGLKNAVSTFFEPVSEIGKRGMDELHQQTVNLLSFQSMPKAVFDEQIAFNMITRFGQSATTSLEAVERRIIRHYRGITSNSLPVPSLMLVQTPVFHGHTFSIYIELAQRADTLGIQDALSGEHISLATAPEDSPSNVNAAGQSQILLAVRPVEEKPNAFWLWGAADNLKLAAITAVECASALSVVRPSGKVQ
jgi:aspartate-semialdehyde dehydrogenase